jgi:hypothetical protein
MVGDSVQAIFSDPLEIDSSQTQRAAKCCRTELCRSDVISLGAIAPLSCEKAQASGDVSDQRAPSSAPCHQRAANGSQRYGEAFLCLRSHGLGSTVPIAYAGNRWRLRQSLAHCVRTAEQHCVFSAGRGSGRCRPSSGRSPRRRTRHCRRSRRSLGLPRSGTRLSDRGHRKG